MPESAIARVPGRRWFIAGSVVLLLLGAVHLLPVVVSLVQEPKTPEEIALDQALRNLHVDMGPFHTDHHGLTHILSESYSLLTLFAGSVNLLVLGPVAAAGRLRALTALNLLNASALTAIPMVWQFPPPMVFGAAAVVCFGVSLILQARKAAA